MGRSPCCEKEHTNKGAWTKEEDERLINYIKAHGEGCWRSLPKAAGLHRCGKSCRLRWINYLRPDLKRGNFTQEEDELIIHLHGLIGNKWSLIAARMPGRTDNEIKNYWNTHIKRKLLIRGIDPQTHRPLNHTPTTTTTNYIINTTTITATKSPHQPPLNPMPLTIPLLDNQNGSIDDASSSSSSSMINEHQQEVVHKELDLELSISLPNPLHHHHHHAYSSSASFTIVNSNESKHQKHQKQQQQQQQQQLAYERLFGASSLAITRSSIHENKVGFKEFPEILHAFGLVTPRK
ncbi:hypothetical protein ACSBR1_009549 [Camellia fascicularis]